MRGLQRSALRAPRLFLDLLFPRHVKCALCDIELGEDFQWNLCPSCVEGLSPVGPYGCRGCGRYVGAFAPQGMCPHCLGDVRWYHSGWSAYVYNDQAQEYVHGLKYHQKPWLAHSMAGQMCTAVQEICLGLDIQCLVPVPIHQGRLLERGYNQAHLLAQELSKHEGIPDTQDLLIRNRATEAQNKLTLSQRISNVKGAFSMAPLNGVDIPRRILLIDDVLTTGNTLNACAQVLREGGAEEITLVTYASVPG